MKEHNIDVLCGIYVPLLLFVCVCVCVLFKFKLIGICVWA